ncbi:hypothetical protein DUI87_16597 [Hirundo rustica rustica]|uniref:Uncharacterized protein n=1 Tax=Hirundo rustica rustica TaxID=333673 RepID=A0A3M0K3Z5_HIRRU|nr:hypothetical protein DUI87_16597 [Hirundo rustica rustica]
MLKVHLNQLLGNTGELLVLVTSVQEEAEDQDLSGYIVQKAPGTLCKAKKRQRCNSSRGEIIGASGCAGNAVALVNGQSLCWGLAVPHKAKSEEIKFEDDMQNTSPFCKMAKMRIDFEELQKHHGDILWSLIKFLLTIINECIDMKLDLVVVDYVEGLAVSDPVSENSLPISPKVIIATCLVMGMSSDCYCNA